jgi:flagellar motor switch protein FliN/FliY
LKRRKKKLMDKKITRILDIPLEVTFVIGGCKMTFNELVKLKKGSIVELDESTSEDIELLINGKKIAYGKTVYVDQNFGVRITEVLEEAELMKTIM